MCVESLSNKFPFDFPASVRNIPPFFCSKRLANSLEQYQVYLNAISVHILKLLVLIKQKEYA